MDWTTGQWMVCMDIGFGNWTMNGIHGHRSGQWTAPHRSGANPDGVHTHPRARRNLPQAWQNLPQAWQNLPQAWLLDGRRMCPWGTGFMTTNLHVIGWKLCQCWVSLISGQQCSLQWEVRVIMQVWRGRFIFTKVLLLFMHYHVSECVIKQ